MEIKFEQTKSDLLAFHRYLILRRKVWWVFIAAVSLIYVFLFRSISLPALMAVGLAAFTGMTAFMFGFSILVAWARISSSGFSVFLGPRRIVFEESGIEYETQGSTSSIKWTTIQRIHETKGHFLLFTTPEHALVIPRRAFTSEEAFRGFVERVRDLGKL